MPNIVFIASGEQLAALGQRFKSELPFPDSFTVVTVYMEDALDYVRTKLPTGTDVILARGNTAKILRTARISTPVVTIPVKDSDLIQAINKAEALYPESSLRLAYIGLEDAVRSVRGFLELIHKKVRLYSVESSRDIRDSVKRARQEQMQVIIGGSYTKKLAEKEGLKCVLLESSMEALSEAYDRALEVQKGVLLQKKKLQEKLVMMNAIADGIVGMNEKGRVTLFNSSAEALFSRRENDVLGKPASALFSEEERALINRILLRGDTVNAHVALIGGQKSLLDFHPVLINGVSRGVIITIRRDDADFRQRPAERETPMEPAGNRHPDRFSEHLTGSHPDFLSACALAARYAKEDFPLLLTGESGTGKTAFAHWIHCASPRKKELFLVREADRLCEEDFLSASGGTLLIRGIEKLSASMVPILTQLLETGTIPLANHTNCAISLRIIATSRETPEKLEKMLPPELFYCLNTFQLVLPPLRSRSSDIPALFEELVAAERKNLTHSGVLANDWYTGPRIQELLMSCPWPGNIRQLKSMARRFAWSAPKEADSVWMKAFLRQASAPADQNTGTHRAGHAGNSQPEPLVPNPNTQAPLQKGFVIHGRLVSYEELRAMDAYYQGRRATLAKHLGISRSTLWRYFKTMNEEGETDLP